MLLVKQRRCRTEQKTHRGQAVGTRGCPQLTGGSCAIPSCAGDGWAGSQLCPGSSPAAGSAAAPAHHSLWLRGCRQCWGKWKLQTVPFPFPFSIPFSSLPFFPSLSSFILHRSVYSMLHFPSSSISTLHSSFPFILLPSSSILLFHPPSSSLTLHPPLCPSSSSFIPHPPFIFHPPSLILLLHSPSSSILHPPPYSPHFQPSSFILPSLPLAGSPEQDPLSLCPLRHLAPCDAPPCPTWPGTSPRRRSAVNTGELAARRWMLAHSWGQVPDQGDLQEGHTAWWFASRQTDGQTDAAVVVPSISTTVTEGSRSKSIMLSQSFIPKAPFNTSMSQQFHWDHQHTDPKSASGYGHQGDAVQGWVGVHSPGAPCLSFFHCNPLQSKALPCTLTNNAWPLTFL